LVGIGANTLSAAGIARFAVDSNLEGIQWADTYAYSIVDVPRAAVALVLQRTITSGATIEAWLAGMCHCVQIIIVRAGVNTGVA